MHVIQHLNFDSKAVQQLMLNFSSVLENSNEEESKADHSVLKVFLMRICSNYFFYEGNVVVCSYRYVDFIKTDKS